MTKPELLFDEESQKKLALSLYADGVFGIHEKPKNFVRLKSGRLSPHYLDIRAPLSVYRVRSGIANTMANLALIASGGGPRPKFDYVAGSPEAMTSYGASIADRLRVGLLQPRVDMLKHRGNKALILGEYETGETVGAFDDVLTDGETKIRTIERLRYEGLNVTDFFVLLDREEGGAAQVEDATGMIVKPALSLSGMVKALSEKGVITDLQFGNVTDYVVQYGDEHARINLGI